MITGFEEITEELTQEEYTLVDVLIAGFSKRTSQNPIKAPEIIRKMQEGGYKITGPRLRKLCNYIRRNGLLPLIATSSGYYCSTDPVDIQKQITSLQERAEGILAASNGLKKFLDTKDYDWRGIN